MIALSDKDRCTACGACVQICPVRAVSLQEDKEGFEYPFINDEICINCAKCKIVCPIKKRAAIVTLFYNNYNFGAQLQNYAVQVYLRNHFIACETLQDFSYPRPEFFFLLRDYFIKAVSVLYHKFPLPPKDFEMPKPLISSPCLSDFQREMINVGPVVNIRHISKKINKRYDCFCVGSDVVWAGCSPFYFLKFADRDKRMCMIPSFGKTEVRNQFIQQFSIRSVMVFLKSFLRGGIVNIYKAGFEGFDHLCVREKSGADIIKKISGQDCEILLDPTLLIDEDEWFRIIKKPLKAPKNKYIVTYLFNKLPPKSAIALKEYAEKKHLEIYDIKSEMLDGYKTRPEEFLYMLKNAEMIVTDSFHGTCFSIVFNKNFISLGNGREKKGSGGKISSLLMRMKLDENMLEDEFSIEDLENSHVDYCDKNKILAAERNKAENFFVKCGLFG